MLISDMNTWGHLFKVIKTPPQHLILVTLTKDGIIFFGGITPKYYQSTGCAFETMQGAAPDVQQLYWQDDRRK